MGIYIGKGNDGFAGARNGEYVDKSGIIAVINSTLETERRFTCVTRSRRFGKSMVADMLCAYYDESCDSGKLFEGLEVSGQPSYGKFLNRFPVISVDITDFTTRFRESPDIISRIDAEIKKDVMSYFPEVGIEEDDNLMSTLVMIHIKTGKKFIMVIDEWDAILREFEGNQKIIDAYVDFLRSLFKGGNSKHVFSGAYLTGILPIKKYRTESALNNFREYSMIDPGGLAGYFGFTPDEVSELSRNYGMDEEILKLWYDGYCIGDFKSIYNPYSVMEALQRHRCKSYWTSTGLYDTVQMYIQMNFDGLKDDIIKMLAGGRCKVNTTKFQNDMSIMTCKDDVLTVLIHLGYLSFDQDRNECYIPNKEVQEQITNAVEGTSWTRLADALNSSQDLLEATLNGNEKAVASGIDSAHDDNTSILSYNDENSLSCVLSIAYYYARNNYIIHRELASGKGFADLVMIPRQNVESPALVIELKFDKAVETAIDQIKQKKYTGKVSEYTDNLLLVGITYDRTTKTHTCKIERA